MKANVAGAHFVKGKLNKGRWLAHPLESSYARSRRLIVANPGVGLLTINSEFSAWGPKRLTDGLEAVLPQSIDCDQPRQCPECAKHLFHPAIYQLPALRRCPVHHISFTLRCPDCDTRWNRALKERYPRCPRCGVPEWPDLANIQLPRHAYQRVAWLERWARTALRDRADHSGVELIDLRALTGWVGTMERPRFQSPTPDHRYYLALEIARRRPEWGARLGNLEGYTVAKLSQQRTTALHSWSPPRPRKTNYHKGSAVPITNQSKVFIQLAIRRLLRWQARTLQPTHTLTWRDYSQLHPEEYVEDGHLCPVCWAFSLWLPTILLKFSSPTAQPIKGSAIAHEACRYTNYDHFPMTPEAVAVKSPQDQWLRPSASFERWLYLRSCDYLFLELLHLAFWFRQRLDYKPSHYTVTVYHSSHRFTVPDLASQLMDLEPSACYQHLTATYLFSSPLDELSESQRIMLESVKCVTQREDDTPLLWRIPPGTLRPDANMVRRLFSELVPRFMAISSGYSWASDIWCASSDLPNSDIDHRVCKTPFKGNA